MLLVKNITFAKIFIIIVLQTVILVKIFNFYLTNFNLKKGQIENYRIFKQNEWIFNFNVTQYTSIISTDAENNLIIEALIFYDHLQDWNYLKENTKCLLLNRQANIIKLDSSELMDIALMGIGFFPKRFCRVKCILSNQNYSIGDVEKTTVSIVDYKYFETHNNFFNKSKKLLTFQEPLFFNQSIPKKPQVVNCVHMVTRLDQNDKLKKIIDWLDILHVFGYAKVKLYLYNLNKETIRNLTERNNFYNNDFIELIHYQTSLEDLCGWRNRNLNQTPHSLLYQFMYKNCLDAFDKHFRMDNAMVYNSHERMISNDCLHSFKYEFEFVTNYDFDEIIFPRLHDTDNFDYFNFNKISENNLLNRNQIGKYQISDYAKKLRNKYGAKNIAYFHFDHVLFFPIYEHFLKELLELTPTQDNITKNDRIIDYKYDGRLVKFKFSNDDHLIKLKKVIDAVNYLNRTYSKTKYYKKWNNAYSSKMNMRDGKSIYVTDFTQSVNQHWANNVSPNTRGHSVSLSDGFVSHIRDEIKGFVYDQTYPIEFLRFDLEYYLFFKSLSNG